MNQEQQHFDARADGYETDIGEEYPQWLKWHLLEKYSNSGDQVVDVGGANGRHSVELATAGRRVTCLDLSQGMLTAMRGRPAFQALDQDAKPKAIVADARQLPLADGMADMSWCYATLLLMPDQERAIAELIRITRPGGHILLDIGMPWNIGWIYWRRFYRKQGFPGIFPLSMAKVRQLAVEGHCRIVEDIPTGFLSQLLYIPLVEKHTSLRAWMHERGARPDRDGQITGKLPGLANRRYIVLQRQG